MHHCSDVFNSAMHHMVPATFHHIHRLWRNAQGSPLGQCSPWSTLKEK